MEKQWRSFNNVHETSPKERKRLKCCRVRNNIEWGRQAVYIEKVEHENEGEDERGTPRKQIELIK